MQKSLDQKLADLKANPNTSKAFILADAKDADMAFGITAPGSRRPLNPEKIPKDEHSFKTLTEYRDQIREIVRQGLVDIMLMSAYNVEQLAINEKLFASSHITPAARANDTTDIWVIRGSGYLKAASRPFRSASIEHMKYGEIDADTDSPTLGADLGLYSVTFTNCIERDYRVLEAFKEFREEAERKKFRYFLEVFDPNVEAGIPPEKLHEFINDHIIRTLAGVTEKGRPQFLKIVYHGPKAMEELAAFDPNLIVGILGGGAGTTYDAFKLLSEAQKYGARVALYGRKINLSEHPLTFVEMLRRIVDGEITPEEAVKAYHAILEKLGVPRDRTLEQDMQLTSGVMSYGGGPTTTVNMKSPASPKTKAQGNHAPASAPKASDARLQQHLDRIHKMFG